MQSYLVSQPGNRGRISADPTDVLTLRQNPNNPDQGKPGQNLIWPGEFIFGYSGQDEATEEEGGITKEGPNSLDPDPGNQPPRGPDCAKDGSYLMIRRLRQDVAGFHRLLKAVDQSIGSYAATVGAYQTVVVNPYGASDPVYASLHVESKHDHHKIPYHGEGRDV